MYWTITQDGHYALLVVEKTMEEDSKIECKQGNGDMNREESEELCAGHRKNAMK